MPVQAHFGQILAGKDIFLCHTGADKAWVEQLAERIENVPFEDRHLGVVFDKWDFVKGKNVVLEIDDHIDKCRFIGLVISKAMLEAEWPTMERTIAVWSDPSGRAGRVIPILLENVDLPPSLRIRNWIDFRDPNRYEEAFLELISTLRGEPVRRGRGGLRPVVPVTSYAPAPVVITGSNGPDVIVEQLISNLLPVVELPTVVQRAETTMRKKKDIARHTERKDVPPFILREKLLFTFSNLHDIENPLEAAIDSKTLRDEDFAPWFGDEDRSRWAMELLNLCLKDHCWKRRLRFDAKGQRFFFLPLRGDDPEKTIFWKIAGTLHGRKVTTRHYAFFKGEDGTPQKQEFGWRHQALRASFLHLPNGLFLKLSPTYMLTKEDGKTPRGGSHVGPILSQWLNQERNGQVLRSLRFWSLVLTRGDRKELRINTGHEAIAVSTTPANGALGFGIGGDTIDYDRLMNAEYQDDLAIPDLQSVAPEQYTLGFEAMEGTH
ncbi:MAG TPA: toll/interleukin-1 receptor domain-containing protein [Bryobacteraceae bacterium]|nr:toll/interleukin-1 receptor domain-containing protein [Bryobacteraceae bacterium]